MRKLIRGVIPHGNPLLYNIGPFKKNFDRPYNKVFHFFYDTYYKRKNRFTTRSITLRILKQ